MWLQIVHGPNAFARVRILLSINTPVHANVLTAHKEADLTVRGEKRYRGMQEGRRSKYSRLRNKNESYTPTLSKHKKDAELTLTANNTRSAMRVSLTNEGRK